MDSAVVVGYNRLGKFATWLNSFGATDTIQSMHWLMMQPCSPNRKMSPGCRGSGSPQTESDCRSCDQNPGF
jgi:hypothetical protein